MNINTSVRALWFTVFVGATLLFCNALSLQGETWALGGGGSWATDANWSPASKPNGIGAIAIFDTPTAARTVTSDSGASGFTVGSISFTNDSNPAFNQSLTTGTTGSNLIFDEAGAGPATITVTGIGLGNQTISVPMNLSDSVIATVNQTSQSSTAGALNLTAAISGTGGFTKQGDGLCTFGTGGKTYTGPTVLNGGRIRISFAARPSATESFTINAGAQLNLISGSSYTFGSGPLNLNGVGAITGPFAAFPGAIRNDRGNGTITINNAIVLQSDTLIHVQALTGTGASATPGATNILAGDISGPGRLTLTAPNSDIDQGFLILNGNNTYIGGTLVSGGFLVASGAAATFGTGNVTLDNSASPVSIPRLRIEAGVQNAIADSATLSLPGGGVAGTADQGYADLGDGINETVGTLVLAGVIQASGTYGSTASSATFKDDEFFSGTGIVTVPSVESQPSLAIALNASDVTISWPTNATGFVLQELAAFSATNVWSDVTNDVIVSGTNNTVTVNSSSGNDFFRLKK
jgi:autotransporter-associated beta strand protein